MRAKRYLAGGRRALAASVAATALACGLGAGAPAAHAGTGCTWAPITLASGWQSEQGTFDTGDPSYCVEDDGTVYLSGSVGTYGSSTAGITVGYLPSEAWPANVLYLDVYTLNGTHGVLRIDTSGVIEAYGGQGDTTQYTSLAGVSYPSASVPQWPIPLENGWQSAQGLYNTGNPALSFSDGVVHLSGSLWRPAGSPTPGPMEAASDLTNPSFWPADNCYDPDTYTYGGAMSTISVINGSTAEALFYPAGTLFATNGRYTSLAGISYPAGGQGAVPWQQVPLLAGQASSSFFCAGLAFVPIGDDVYFGGDLTLPVGFVGEFAVLPPAVRPAHNLYMIASDDVAVRIAPDGGVSVINSLGASQTEISLSGLSFALGS